MPNGAFDAGENGENDDKQKDFAKRLVFLPPPLSAPPPPLLVLLGGGAVLCVRAPNPFVPLPGGKVVGETGELLETTFIKQTRR